MRSPPLQPRLRRRHRIRSGHLRHEPACFGKNNDAGQRRHIECSSNTRIFGPTTGSGATLTQLVTVNGNNQFTVFGTAGTNDVLSGLTITNGNGGGISNGLTLTVVNSDISANNGAGISNTAR